LGINSSRLLLPTSVTAGGLLLVGGVDKAKLKNPSIVRLPVVYDSLDRNEVRGVREQYISKQGGKCYYCGASLSGKPSRKARNKRIQTKYFPDSFFKYPIHLHHDHRTGLTLGAVHNHCNAVLWQHHKE
jgi:hypothetical protein